MAFPRGVVLREWDHLVLRLIGDAGVLLPRHLHGLEGGGASVRVVRRRLRTLADAGLVVWHGSDESRVAVSLSTRGALEVGIPWSLAEGLDAFSARVSLAEWGHIVLTGDVFVALRAATGEGRYEWTADRGRLYRFEAQLHGFSRPRIVAVRPDALVCGGRSPATAVRAFLEIETGAHSVTTEQRDNAGAMVRKAQRYAAFFLEAPASPGPRTSWYGREFADQRAPVLVFVVRTSARRDVLTRALSSSVRLARAPGAAPQWRWSVVVAEDAGRHLASLLGESVQDASGALVEDDAGRRLARAAMREAVRLTNRHVALLRRAHREVSPLLAAEIGAELARSDATGAAGVVAKIRDAVDALLPAKESAAGGDSSRAPAPTALG